LYPWFLIRSVLLIFLVSVLCCHVFIVCFFLCLLCPMLPVSLDGPFLIAPIFINNQSFSYTHKININDQLSLFILCMEDISVNIWTKHLRYNHQDEVLQIYTELSWSTKLRRDIVTLPSVRPSFCNILVNTLESASFNGFWPNLVHT
jgi:hypothetical protein